MKLLITREAGKALRKMPAKQAQAIRRQLEKLAEDPERNDLDVTALEGRAAYRLRVGKWRAIYEMTDDAVVVKLVRTRGDVYKR